MGASFSSRRREFECVELVDSHFWQDSCLAEKNNIFVDEVRFKFLKSCYVTDKRAESLLSSR